MLLYYEFFVSTGKFENYAIMVEKCILRKANTSHVTRG